MGQRAEHEPGPAADLEQRARPPEVPPHRLQQQPVARAKPERARLERGEQAGQARVVGARVLLKLRREREEAVPLGRLERAARAAPALGAPGGLAGEAAPHQAALVALHEEGGVHRVEPGKPARRPGRQGVVARAQLEVGAQPVVRGQPGQRAPGEDPQVRLAGRVGLHALHEVARVAHDHLVAHVAGCGLPAHGQGHDVVPAREVVRGHDGVAARLQDACDLPHEGVGLRHVLDHLVRVHHVDAPVLERQRVAEVAGHHVHAGAPGRGGELLDELHAEHLVRAHVPGDIHRPGAVAAAEIEQRGARPGVHDREDHPPVLVLGRTEESLEVAHGVGRLR